MPRSFKSRTSKVIKSFFKSILLLCFVLASLIILTLVFTGVLRNNSYSANRQLLIVLLLPIVCFSVVLGAFFAFRRYNIRVEVRYDAIVFFRGSKEYLHFRYSDYKFSTLVSKQSYNLVPISATRMLCVIPKNGDKSKNHTCHCFAKNDFEEMIALLRQASYEWEAAYEGKQYPDESRLVVTRFEAAADSYEAAGQEEISSLELLPLEFNVNKEAWIKRYPLLTMSVVYGVMLLLVFFGAVIPTIIGGNSTNIAFAGGFFLFLLILFGGLHYALCIAPIRRIKKSAPERIVLDADKIVIDGKVFSFFNTERITATPDSYVVTSATFRRNLSITEGGLTYVFPLGPSDAIKKKGPPVFENYDLFYRTLQSIFLVKSARENAPCKFSAELH